MKSTRLSARDALRSSADHKKQSDAAVFAHRCIIGSKMDVITVFLLALLDRLFKILAERYLASGQLIVLIPKVLGLKLLVGGNTGAAFGILAGKTWILAGISAFFSAVLLYILATKKFKNDWIRWGFILITAGAVGNLYDRLFIHSVTDYLMFLFVDFPIFNFADCMVDVGVAIIIIYLLKERDDSFFIK